MVSHTWKTDVNSTSFTCLLSVCFLGHPLFYAEAQAKSLHYLDTMLTGESIFYAWPYGHWAALGISPNNRIGTY
jgi:hypothetical protein